MNKVEEEEKVEEECRREGFVEENKLTELERERDCAIHCLPSMEETTPLIQL